MSHAIALAACATPAASYVQTCAVFESDSAKLSFGVVNKDGTVKLLAPMPLSTIGGGYLTAAANNSFWTSPGCIGSGSSGDDFAYIKATTMNATITSGTFSAVPGYTGAVCANDFAFDSTTNENVVALSIGSSTVLAPVAEDGTVSKPYVDLTQLWDSNAWGDEKEGVSLYMSSTSIYYLVGITDSAENLIGIPLTNPTNNASILPLAADMGDIRGLAYSAYLKRFVALTATRAQNGFRVVSIDPQSAAYSVLYSYPSSVTDCGMGETEASADGRVVVNSIFDNNAGLVLSYVNVTDASKPQESHVAIQQGTALIALALCEGL